MRKVCLLLVAVVATGQLYGQNEPKKHEFSIGLGLASDVRLDNLLKEAIEGVFDEELSSTGDDKRRSGFYLGYKYRMHERWALGATMTYKHYSRKRWSEEITARYRQNFYGLNLEGQFTYLSKPVFRMYAVAGAGAYLFKENLRRTGAEQSRSSNDNIKFTWQFSPLCFEIGKSAGVKMEYGFGYKGIGSVGAYYRF